jgi:hypothetical protein
MLTCARFDCVGCIINHPSAVGLTRRDRVPLHMTSGTPYLSDQIGTEPLKAAK